MKADLLKFNYPICTDTKRGLYGTGLFFGSIQKTEQLINSTSYVHIFSARGTAMEINSNLLTEEQVRTWGRKYDAHEHGKAIIHFYVGSLGKSDKEFLQ